MYSKPEGTLRLYEWKFKFTLYSLIKIDDLSFDKDTYEVIVSDNSNFI